MKNLEKLIKLIQPILNPDFILSDAPISLYSKNGLVWIKIPMIYLNNESKIRYSYNGFLNESGVFKSRDCFSFRHQEISNKITSFLNQHDFSQKVLK